MTLPRVRMKELDRQLGVLPPGTNMIAIVADSTAGDFDTPAAFANDEAVSDTFGAGKAVELAAYAIEHYGLIALIVRTHQNVAASNSDFDFDFAGTSTPSIHAGTLAADDLEPYLVVVNDGDIGTDGIQVQWSLDAGRTLSVPTDLGTDTFFEFPDASAGDLRVDFTAGTVKAGDALSFRTKGPSWDATALGSALDALGASKQPWEGVIVLGDATGSDVDILEAKLEELHEAGKHRWGVMHFRMPDADETDEEYQDAFDGAMSSHHTTNVDVQSCACKALSSVSGRQYRRPITFGVAPLYVSLSEEEDAAELVNGPLPGIQIVDANGNPDEHDENETPGLDDLRSTTLRTVPGRDGVYVTNPRIFSEVGSDFEFLQHRRVMNLARTTAQAYLQTLLSRELVVDAKTGFILASEAEAIDTEANAELDAALLSKPKASAAVFTLSRNDNLLSTKRLTYKIRIVPLAYPKEIVGTISFFNPALRIRAAA